MAGRIEGAPRQIAQALAACEEQPWRLSGPEPDLLAVGALGGSAISADLAAACDRDRLPRTLITVRDYRWPACVGRGSLALLSSYSGETEETLALYQEAGERGAGRAAITSGGTLAEWCARDGVPRMAIPGGAPPRTMAYASWVMVSRLLEALGWVPDPGLAWREAVERLEAQNVECGSRTPEARNPAKRMARELYGHFLLIYAGSGRLEPVATRMRNQINENAKLLAHSALVPELNHNEIVGWERPGPLQGRAAVLIVRDAEDSPEIAARLTLTAEVARRHGAKVVEVGGQAGGRLARMAALVQFGDYLSLYLALLAGVDPTPIASIVEFKRRLSQRRESGV